MIGHYTSRAGFVLGVVALVLSLSPALAHESGSVSNVGAADKQIRSVQRALNDGDFDAGPVDGRFGPRTASAIRAYQADWDLPQTGQITPELVAMLERRTPETKPGWHKIIGMDCHVWNNYPGPKESVTWTGECVDGLASGAGKLVWWWVRNGKWRVETFEGEQRAGRRHGQGTVADEYSHYQGEFREGNRHGRGTAVFSDGVRYEGEWRDNLFDGQGIYTTEDGFRYEGGYRKDTQHGEGTAVFSNGDRYEGEWQNGQPHGWGVGVFADGRRVEGEWVNGSRPE